MCARLLAGLSIPMILLSVVGLIRTLHRRQVRLSPSIPQRSPEKNPGSREASQITYLTEKMANQKEA
jgi:hypothetical protein